MEPVELRVWAGVPGATQPVALSQHPRVSFPCSMPTAGSHGGQPALAGHRQGGLPSSLRTLRPLPHCTRRPFASTSSPASSHGDMVSHRLVLNRAGQGVRVSGTKGTASSIHHHPFSLMTVCGRQGCGPYGKRSVLGMK